LRASFNVTDKNDKNKDSKDKDKDSKDKDSKDKDVIVQETDQEKKDNLEELEN